jgi:methylmalonyl-CoA mutase cobalamin-binding domain/chain
VVVGGIIPSADESRLAEAGVARVYTPKDFRIVDIVSDLADLAIDHRRHSVGGSGGTGKEKGPISSIPSTTRPMERT